MALGPDNLRTMYREDPRFFFQNWNDASNGATQLYNMDGQQHDWFHGLLHGFDKEHSFPGGDLCAFCRSWWWISYVVATLYLISLWMGTSSMRHCQPFDLKKPLAAWNLFLAVFSFIGFLRTAPALFTMLNTYGFSYSLCKAAGSSYGTGAPGLWVCLFIFSKYFELIDTVFLVVRKKKVGFLHWYHHCSVLLYCWHAYVSESPTGIYFVVMNYFVHAVMYFYYFLAAVCARPPKWALAVTVLQLSQMAIGVAVTISHMRVLMFRTVPNCDGHIPNLTGALSMYASYFYLFAQFLFGRYCKPRDDKASGRKLQ